jgi:hypothetical protein
MLRLSTYNLPAMAEKSLSQPANGLELLHLVIISVLEKNNCR